MSPEQLPSLHHILKIREDLFKNREWPYGRAAVMVGAGFSRNGDKKSQAGKPFPLWLDLGKALFDELYPECLTSIEDSKKSDPDRERWRLQKTSGMGSVELAQEYAASQGRMRLEEFLHSSIPDLEYEPGILHEALLGLP